MQSELSPCILISFYYSSLLVNKKQFDLILNWIGVHLNEFRVRSVIWLKFHEGRNGVYEGRLVEVRIE